MPIRDLGELLHPELTYNDVPWERREDPADPKSPKIKGTSTYVIPSPDAKDGLRLAILVNLGMAAATGKELTQEDLKQLQLDDGEERDQYRQVLSDAVYDQMLTDGVAWLALKAIAQDALIFFGMSEEVANLSLELQKSGKPAARANRADRRATSTARTPQTQAGSGSKKARTATRDRTRSRTSTPSSSETPTATSEAQAI